MYLNLRTVRFLERETRRKSFFCSVTLSFGLRQAAEVQDKTICACVCVLVCVLLILLGAGNEEG